MSLREGKRQHDDLKAFLRCHCEEAQRADVAIFWQLVPHRYFPEIATGFALAMTDLLVCTAVSYFVIARKEQRD